MRTSLLLAVVLISVIGLGGCQQPQASRQPEPAPLLAQNQLTMAQNGSSLTLKVGEQVAVALPGSPQSGYQWQVEQTPGPFLQKQASSFEPAPPREVCGMQHLQFTAKGEGRGVLTLAYRPVNGQDDVANYYTLRLRVIR
ncbi:protease inhibitor I42 family protein [Pseudaeromonas pectinilytica]